MMKKTSMSLLALMMISCSKSSLCDLKCEYTVEPIAIDIQNPRFTWAYNSEKDFQQQSFSVAIASSPDQISNPDIWSSGCINTSKAFVELPDSCAALAPHTKYYWQVTAQSTDGKQLQSQIAQFRTAFLSEDQWQAKWITDSSDDLEESSPMLRRTFGVKSGVKSAILYISAAAYEKTLINGKTISNDYLSPGYTHYDKRNLYATYDVTDLLNEGQNVITSALGNGFYNSFQPVATWEFEKARWRARAKMICELHIEYQDGSKDKIISDKNWKFSRQSPYRSNNIYSGDVYDARLEIEGWNTPSLDESSLEMAVETPAPSQVLKSQIMPAIRISKELKPINIQSFGDSIYVYDFGQNITGLCRLEVEGQCDTRIDLTHGEFLKPSGRIEMRNLDIYFTPQPGYEFQTDTYILKGRGKETWTPSFTYHGFRYVELKTSKPIDPKKLTLTALFMHTNVKSVGEFACSNPLFNKIWEMSRQTYLNNLTSIPTDCPQREKNGWTADGYLALDLALLNYDGKTFYEKWLDDFCDNITPEGRLSGIIPSYGWGYADWIGPVWDAAAFIIPNTLYNYYGDTKPIEKMWQTLERYLRYLQTREDADGGVTYGIGDWVYYKTTTPTEYTSTCYYYYDNVLMARFARLLGRDAQPYEAKAAQLLKLINTKYYNNTTKLYANGSQAAQGVALYLGIAPKEDAQQVADNLNEMIIKNDYFLDFGTIGSKTVLRMLSKYGHAETAYELAAKEECPSWGWWVKQGFTTLAETWALSPEWRDASIDHVFLGDVAAWYVNDLVGINYDAEQAGYNHIVFRPNFVKQLDWAKASYHAQHGLIQAQWTRSGDQVQYTVVVPANTTAKVCYKNQTHEIKAGTHHFSF